MGRTALNPVRYVGMGRNIVAGSFVTKNGAVPTDIRGSGFTVAYVSEGIWTVTLDDVSQRIDCVTFGVAAETTTKLSLVQEDQDARTTSVIKITQHLSDDLTSPNFAVADEPGNVISFMIVCKDTAVADW